MRTLTFEEACRWLTEEAGALLTPREIAPLVGRHPDTIRAWCASGVLPSIQPGGTGFHLVRRCDVAEFLGIPLGDAVSHGHG